MTTATGTCHPSSCKATDRCDFNSGLKQPSSADHGMKHPRIASCVEQVVDTSG